MKRRFLIFILAILAVVCLCVGLTACGGDDSTDDENYNQDGGTGDNTDDNDDNASEGLFFNEYSTYCEVSGKGNCTDTDIIIPSKYNGKTVTSVADYAFTNDTSITSVTIPNSVTEIGASSFCDCSSMTSITIGKGVTAIDQNAFYGCTSLTGVYIKDLSAWCEISFSSISITNPLYYAHNLYLNGELITELVISDNVSSIGDYAFEYCSVTSVSISENVEKIGDYAFAYCGALTEINFNAIAMDEVTQNDYLSIFLNSGTYEGITVNIGANVTKVPAYIFYSLQDSLINVEFAENCKCTSIGEYAFAYSGLTSLTLPASIKTIENCAFMYCLDLSEINFNATSMDDLATNNYVFYSVGSESEELTVNIGADVTKIPAYLFYPNYEGIEITGIVFEENSQCASINNYAFAKVYGLSALSIPDNVKTIGNSAFYNTSITSVTLGSGVESVGNYAFQNCSSLQAVYIDDIASWCGINFAYYYANPLYYAGNLYVNSELLTTLVIPDGVTAIGDYAFYKYNNLTSVTIGSSVKSIGTSAFYMCSSLNTVNVTDISSWCGISFADSYANPLCNAQCFYIDDKVVSEIVIPDSITQIADYAFYNNKNLTSVTIGSGVQTIGKSAFMYCSKLSSLTMGSNVTAIDTRAFYGCLSLNNVTLPDNLKTINDYAFYNCNTFTDITIPDSVTAIGEYAFFECGLLATITMGSGVESIGDYAFANCRNLTTISSIPETTVYNMNIIDGCSSFDKKVFATLYDNGYYLDTELIAIEDSSVSYFIVKDGTTAISASVFAECTNLRFIYIPESVTSIGADALNFTIPDTYTFILMLGASDISNIIESYSTWLGTFATSGTTVTFANGSSITASSTSYLSYLTSCYVADGYVYRVESNEAVIYAYYGTETDVTVANTLGGYSVTGINGFAFTGSDITKVTLPSTVTSLGGSYTLFNTTMAYAPFYMCSALTSVTFAAQSVDIESYCFYKCTNLTSIDFGSAVIATIYNNAFDSCTSLTSITLPSMLMISQNIFNGCTSLTSVTAGSGDTITITAYVSSDGPNYSANISISNGTDLATALKETYANYTMLYINIEFSSMGSD